MRGNLLSLILYVVITTQLIAFALSLPFADSKCTTSNVMLCTGITCGMDTHQIFTSNNTGCACRLENIGRRFTECNNATQTKSLFQFYKPPATCIATAPLEEPIHDIPCALSCGQGYKFDTQTKSCMPCEKGSFSYGSSVEVRQWSKEKGLLAQMRTYCDTFYWGRGCNMWTINEAGYLESGNNKKYDNLVSTLEYNVEISEPVGVLTFEYMVAAEEYFDYFGLSIDNGDYEFKVSNTEPVDEWKTFSMNITRGFHNIKFVYHKDTSENRGYDMARIRLLRLTGISDIPIDCKPCEKGFISDGTHACRPCPAGYYTDEEKQSECKLCPTGQSSFEGSSTCFALSFPCSEQDYYSYFRPCVNGETSKVYEWIQPHICNASHPESISLPATVPGVKCNTLPRPKCDPGQEYSETTFDCQYCRPGTHSPNGDKCLPCESGEAAENRIIFLEKFVTRDADMARKLLTSSCKGECSSKGWRLTDSFMDSGIGNGISQSWVDVNVTGLDANKIAINYGISCNVGGGSFDIEVDGLVMKSIECAGCSNFTDGYQMTEVELPESARTIRLSYNTLSLLSDDAYYCDKTIISKIAIHINNPVQGGAPSCSACSAGEFTENGWKCSICPAGTKSDRKSTRCAPCQPNTFSYEGSSTCHQCGNGMVSGEGAAKCEWQYGKCHYNGTLFDLPREFAFDPLSASLLPVPGSFSQEPETSFHFNLCGDSIGRAVRKVQQRTENPCISTGSFVCKKNKGGDVVSLGKSIDITTGASESSGLQLHFKDLSEQNCFNNATQQYQNYEAIINIKCNSEGSEDFVGPSISLISACVYKMEFISKFGCPLCTDDDYSVLEGQCNAKTLTKEIVYVKKTDKAHRCYRGVEKPKEVVSCVINVVTAPYWIVGAILGGAGLVIIVLAIVAVFFYFKFRDASKRFHRLQEGDNEGIGREVELD